MRRELDFLVIPLGGTVLTGDEAHTVNPPEVTEHERVACLGVGLGAYVEREMPLAAFVPGVCFEVRVFVLRGRLGFGPTASQHVTAGVDEGFRLGNAGSVHAVGRHRLSRYPAIGG